MPNIVGDYASVTAFWNKIPGSSDSGQGFHMFPCNATLPDISFRIGGRDFPISTQSLNYGPVQTGSDKCIGGIMSDLAIARPLWILGSSVLANFYTVFDVGNSQVGFATFA
jgi:cathepsin D